jgi:hypothetical protein
MMLAPCRMHIPVPDAKIILHSAYSVPQTGMPPESSMELEHARRMRAPR